MKEQEIDNKKFDIQNLHEFEGFVFNKDYQRQIKKWLTDDFIEFIIKKYGDCMKSYLINLKRSIENNVFSVGNICYDKLRKDYISFVKKHFYE